MRIFIDETRRMLCIVCLLTLSFMTNQAFAVAQSATPTQAEIEEARLDSVVMDSLSVGFDEEMPDIDEAEEGGMYKAIKKKFIEGNAGFMSLVALALVLGLAFCIERIIYLSLSEINAKKFVADLDEKIMAGKIAEAKEQCRNTRGPVASICYQGLERINQPLDDIERSISSYGSVQIANLEKGCSWITLFIAMAPSLGFLGTVIGMVMAFNDIQMAGDLNASVVAAGMKVALITTIFGIIVALILQVFYNYILAKVESLTSNMEEAAQELLTMCVQSDKCKK